MTKINSWKDLSKAQYNAFCRETEAALAAVESKYGVKFKIGNGRFSGGSMDLKLNASLVSENGQVQTREASDFAMLAQHVGLKPEWLGKSFKSEGVIFTITGYRSKAPKRPVTASGSDGKSYVFPTEIVALHMNKQS